MPPTVPTESVALPARSWTPGAMKALDWLYTIHSVDLKSQTLRIFYCEALSKIGQNLDELPEK